MLSAEQKSNAIPAIIRGDSIDSYLKTRPVEGEDEQDFRSYWAEVEAEVKATPLKPGEFYDVPGEWS